MYRLLLIVLILCSCRETIVHNLSEPEANRMLAHLYDQKLLVKKEKQADGRWCLSLPSEEAASGIRTLDSHKLLREPPIAVNDSASFMNSNEQERFKYERALSREIETTLSGLPSVLQARVHLNLPVSDPLFAAKKEDGSASVMLVAADENINKQDVVALVAGASGIEPAVVSVVLSLSAVKVEQIPVVVESAASIGFMDRLKKFLIRSLSYISMPFLFCLSAALVFILVFRQFNKRNKIMI